MARRNDIQYVRFYTVGTAAPRVAPKAEPEVVTHSPKKAVKRIPIPFDPVSVIGTAVAVVMLVCVFIGLWQLNRVSTQVQEMEAYISAVKAENSILQAEYRHGYDLEEVRAAAVSMGMIPADQAERITVPAVSPAPAEQTAPTSWWAEFWADLRMLFA